MKRFIVNIFLILNVVCGLSTVKAEAYSVKVQNNGIYAKYIPKHILKNVPSEYKDFHDVITEIKADDEIVICNPFVIYQPSYGDGQGVYRYYFIVKKNNNPFSIFSIYIDEYNAKLQFNYDKIIDKYTFIKDKISDNSLVYELGNRVYSQTKDKTDIVYDKTNDGVNEMTDNAGNYNNANIVKFKLGSYDEKKKIIISYLSENKSDKLVKKSEENDKLDLNEEIEENNGNNENKKDGKKTVLQEILWYQVYAQ